MRNQLFTPRLSSATLERANMMISEDDYSPTERYGRTWTAIVTDLETGKIYLVEGADCNSLGCRCDAVIVAELKSRTPETVSPARPPNIAA